MSYVITTLPNGYKQIYPVIFPQSNKIFVRQITHENRRGKFNIVQNSVRIRIAYLTIPSKRNWTFRAVFAVKLYMDI